MSTATRRWPRRSPRWGSGRARAGSCWRPRAASDVTLLDALPFGMGIVLAALVGMILGSFIATLVLRWPAGRSVLGRSQRSEEHTSELQSLMRISYAVSCLKK